MTSTLDMIGYSLVFPVLAPLLLNSKLAFFATDTPVEVRTTVLGALFAIFGVLQFFGASLIGALADHFGRYKAFLGSIGVSIFGYLLMALSVYWQDLTFLFVGRAITGLCSGNFALAQSATADLTDVHHRSKAFGVLSAVSGLGWVAGPWVGGKLANPEWLFGSGAFLFAAIAAILNLFVVLLFYTETWSRKEAHTGLLDTIKDLGLVFHHQKLRIILMTYLLFSTGWGFFLIFSPTFLVQRFSLTSSEIGDIFVYMSVVWFFVSMFLNKELIGRCSLRALILSGMVISFVGVLLFLLPETLWPYWIFIPIALTGGALAYVNLNSLLSLSASEKMQGRAMGAGGSMWAIAQIIAPLAAGVLAGWNMYSPLFVGALIILCAFIYFITKPRLPES